MNQTWGTPARRAARAPVQQAAELVTTSEMSLSLINRAVLRTQGMFQAQENGCFRVTVARRIEECAQARLAAHQPGERSIQRVEQARQQQQPAAPGRIA